MLELDAVLETVGRAKLDFDEHTLRREILRRLEKLSDGLDLLGRVGTIPPKVKSEVLGVVVDSKTLKAQFEKKEQSYKDLTPVGHAIAQVTNDVDISIREYCSNLGQTIEPLKDVAAVLGIPVEQTPDPLPALETRDYSRVGILFDQMIALENGLDASIRDIFRKEGWSTSMAGLFKKIRTSTSINKLTDEDWKLLASLRDKPLGSKIKLGVGS